MTFAVAPLAGAWSDRVGRRPLLALGLLASLAQKAALAAHVFLGGPLVAFFAACLFNGAVAPITVALAALGDALPAHRRAAGFAAVFGASALSLAAGPAAGATLGLRAALIAALALQGAGIIFAAVRVRRCLSCDAPRSF